MQHSRQSQRSFAAPHLRLLRPLHTDAYTFLLPIAANRLLMAYTDFQYPASDGTIPKAILVRDITIHPKSL